MKQNLRGFTLIELMVVVLIIMLLSGVIIVNVDQARKKARDAKRIADINTVATALQAYYADNHVYPGDIESWCEFGAGECYYPKSKRNYLDMVSFILKPGGYLSNCPQESNMNLNDCDGVPGGYVDGSEPLPWGYRYTNWEQKSYAIVTPVEIPQNATINPGNSSLPEYRLCNGQPWYSGDCL